MHVTGSPRTMRGEPEYSPKASESLCENCSAAKALLIRLQLRTAEQAAEKILFLRGRCFSADI